MEILKLVISVMSILGGVTIIIKLYVGGLKEIISTEKEQRKDDIKEIKEEIKNLYDTRVSEKICQERCKK